MPQSQKSTLRYIFSKAFSLEPHRFYVVSGKVNGADKIYLVLDSVKPDTKHPWSGPSPTPPYGAGENVR